MRIPSRLPPIPDEIIEAFRAVAPTLEGFARDRELSIERYRQGKAAWELTTEPEQGGRATLTVSYRERTGHVLDVSAVWWLDDAATHTRRLHSEKIGIWQRRDSPQALRATLEEGLRRINGWTATDLGPARGPYPAGDDAGQKRESSGA